MLVWTGFYSGYILINKNKLPNYQKQMQCILIDLKGKLKLKLHQNLETLNLPKSSVFFAFDILLLDGFILVYKSTTDNKVEQVLVL